METLMTFDPKKNKVVMAGKYNPDTKTFERKVNHFHRVRFCDGYATAVDVLDKLKELGCEDIIIKTDGGNVYKSKLEHWTGPRALLNKDYGHGIQNILPVKLMNGGIDDDYKARAREAIQAEQKQAQGQLF